MQPKDEIIATLANTEAKLGSTTLLTIDGPSGAGKTTLAAELQEQLEGAYVIHMDDLYAGWDDAIDEKLYTRIEFQIFRPLAKFQSPNFQQFNWHTNQFEDWIKISIPRYLILEGVGSTGLPNRPWISLSVFLQVSDKVGLERVRNRDGEDIAAYIPAWQAMQRHHFLQHETETFSDLIYAL